MLVTGGTGFVGSVLVTELRRCGHEVTLLTRSAGAPDHRRWDPINGELDPAHVAGQDGVIHLAGESIMGFWTKAKRQRIRDSRVLGTSLLTRTILALPEDQRPRCFISASAIGYYAERGETVLTDDAPPGSGWLADVCVEWEQASTPLADAGMRVAWMRIAVVLDPSGGALKVMLPAFKAGLAGRLGTGRQWFSWLSRRDLVAALLFALEHDEISGPVNAASPGALTNAGFTKLLAEHLHRPAILPAPGPILRMLPGQMAEQSLLASARVEPVKLKQAGFHWKDPGLQEFLKNSL